MADTFLPHPKTPNQQPAIAKQVNSNIPLKHTFPYKHQTISIKKKINQVKQLIKMKVVIVMMFSSVIGMLITPKFHTSISKIITGIIGISMSACASAALNHIFDKNEDKKMQRTQSRPLAAQKIPPQTALIFSIIIIALSTAILAFCNNLLCAILTLTTTIGYSILYTKWLKPTTPQNIVIGGLSGAMPPLLGWTSITGEISVEPLLLVLIVFTWTPAHFWPLAIHHSQDYAKTKWPMLPVTHGIEFTKLSILAYAALTTASSMLPFCIQMTGKTYLIITSIVNMRWLYLCFKLWKDTKKAMPVFKFSIVYIVIIFSALLIDHQPLNVP